MIANARWTDALRSAVARGEPAVLVVVGATSGSTPRERGAAMVVTASAQAGTIGGGTLEHEATRLAREALVQQSATAATWAVRFPLAARLGQCCGGVATLVFATVAPDAGAWLDVVAGCERAAVRCAVVGRLGGDGAAGRLVVTLDDARGSLGEAALDSAAIAAARAQLAGERPVEGLVDLDDTSLFVHVVAPSAFPVCVFGNGHVGRALVQVLGALPVEARWIDTREHDFPPRLAENVVVVATDDPVAEVAAAPRGACLVIATHSHALDFDLVAAALARDDWRYVGLIGSKAKRTQFERRLAHRGGFAPDAMTRVTCPIGATLAGKEPGVIAVGVAAELLALRERERLSARPRQDGVAAAPIGARMRALRSRPSTD